MTESDKPIGSIAKKAITARQKRLRIHRMKSEIAMDSLTPDIDRTFAGDRACCEKRRMLTQNAYSDTKLVGGDGSLMSEISPPGPTSSESTGGAVDGGVEESENLSYFSHGSISVIGRRRTMEDAVMVVTEMIGGEFAFFAVYDGHGGSGVANACRVRLHHLLEMEMGPDKLTGGGGGIDWEKAMMSCFAKMDEEVNRSIGGGIEGEGGSSSGSVKMTGSTAVVVMVGKEVVVVANCGDSRAVLCRGGVAVPLSHDHKPDRTDERKRVEAVGGKVINWNGFRILGVLATSRSIGDHYLKPYVISEPEVTVSRRTDSDDFLIIASDGLWDVVSNEVACDFVSKCFDGQIRKRSSEGRSAAEAAAMLAELAISRGSKDNISIIVVELKKSSCSIL